MYKYAQILYNKAHWIFETEETLEELYQRFAPDIVFIDITNRPEVHEGWEYENGNFIDPTPTLEELKTQALAALDAEYDPQFDALTLAWATALMSGDTQTAEARLADKQTLQQKYEEKKEAILNG